MRILLRLAYNLLRLITWPLWGLLPRVGRRRPVRWVSLHLQGDLGELRRPMAPLLSRLVARVRPGHVAVSDVRRLCARMAADPGAEALLITLSPLQAGWATLSSLRNELLRLREAQRRVVVFLPQGGSQRELYVASAADLVITPPSASFSALGPVAARPYLAPLLAKLGLRVEVFAQGSYKTAAESLVRDSMSEPEREQLTALLDSVHAAWVSALALRPRLGEAGARGLLEAGLLGAEQAEAQGLVDVRRYEDELEKVLGLGAKEHARAAGRYLRATAPRPLFLPLRQRPHVAVVRLHGPIAERASGRGIGLHTTAALLRALRKNPRVLGVILFIDSPGGSAVVSDLLHREIELLDKQKPVVAWLGDVAASGGYYLAAATRHIVAQPTTVTGSIGVIAARPVAEELFERVGVRQAVVKLSPHADMNTLARDLDADERALLLGETRRFYERFLEVVATGRRRPREVIEPLAGGRVWSGRDAQQHGLVDTLGGYREARAALDALLGEQAAMAEAEPVFVSPPLRADPQTLPAQAAFAWLGRLVPNAERGLELVDLLGGGERVLAYAVDLPDVT